MGRRKSIANRAPKKRPEKLDVEFDCPFCGHPKCVECEILKKENIGKLSCRICDERYCVALTPLTEPIDIYLDWIDECERINTDDYDEDYDDRSESTPFIRMRVEV